MAWIRLSAPSLIFAAMFLYSEMIRPLRGGAIEVIIGWIAIVASLVVVPIQAARAEGQRRGFAGIMRILGAIVLMVLLLVMTAAVFAVGSLILDGFHPEMLS